MPCSHLDCCIESRLLYRVEWVINNMADILFLIPKDNIEWPTCAGSFSNSNPVQNGRVQPLETGAFSSLLIFSSSLWKQNKKMTTSLHPIEEVRTAGVWDRCVRKRLGPHRPLHSASNTATIHLPRPGYHLGRGGGRGGLGLVALLPCFDLVFVHFFLCPNMLSTGVRSAPF